jgi:hypothetical protein
MSARQKPSIERQASETVDLAAPRAISSDYTAIAKLHHQWRWPRPYDSTAWIRQRAKVNTQVLF